MAKEKQEPYEFLSNLVLALMNADRIFSNSFFISEFAVSPKTLGEIRRGEDMCIYQYVRVIRCMTKYLHLIIQMDMLLKELRIVLSSHCDLVVATLILVGKLLKIELFRQFFKLRVTILI